VFDWYIIVYVCNNWSQILGGVHYMTVNCVTFTRYGQWSLICLCTD